MVAAPFRNIEVLVADDEAQLLEILRSTLITAGYGCTAVDSGEKALSVLNSRQINILVCDVYLGKTDGLELGQKIRQTNANLAFVFISGKPSVKAGTRAQQLSAIQYVAKPFDPKEFTETVSLAARWNVAQLIVAAAEKYFAIRREHLQKLHHNIQRVKSELKNLMISKQDVRPLRDFVLTKNSQAHELFLLLDAKLIPFSQVK